MPEWLKPSACVDLAQVLAGARKTLRTELQGAVTTETVRRWARGLGLFVSVDVDGFIALSRQPGAARRLLALDRSLGDHTRELGRLLGYPPCCCRAAALVGEASIDEWEQRATQRQYFGRFKAIDPKGYREGRSRISHIPCSACCGASLVLALATTKGMIFVAGKWRPVAKRAVSDTIVGVGSRSSQCKRPSSFRA